MPDKLDPYISGGSKKEPGGWNKDYGNHISGDGHTHKQHTEGL